MWLSCLRITKERLIGLGFAEELKNLAPDEFFLMTLYSIYTKQSTITCIPN
jgi:hypothetical protein